MDLTVARRPFHRAVAPRADLRLASAARRNLSDSRRLPGAHGYDTAGFVANLDYCSRETGLSRGFAHYEDFPLDLWDVFLRYTGLGSRIDILTPASVVNRLLKERWGDKYDVIPRCERTRERCRGHQPFVSRLAHVAVAPATAPSSHS